VSYLEKSYPNEPPKQQLSYALKIGLSIQKNRAPTKESFEKSVIFI